jgi:fumarylacetoacetase
MPDDATPAHPFVDPSLKSWVESANDPDTDFPIQNLPLCAFYRAHDGHVHPHLGMAIGDQVLDVTALAEAEFFDKDRPPPEDDEDPEEIDEEYEYVDHLFDPNWSYFASDVEALDLVREKVQEFLKESGNVGQPVRRLRQKVLVPQKGMEFLSPISPICYTDFYASIHHASTVGSMFRPDNPLLPNYKHVPIGYHGRSSSIVPSGSEVRRPLGQQAPPDDAPAGTPPSFGPCKMLDYELEVGCFVGPGNAIGAPIPIAEAAYHVVGYCLVNDWSARDIQKWEYQPLGPFLAKNFATTISPFVVTADAMEPFRVASAPRPAGDPEPLAYLNDEEDRTRGALDITLEVYLLTAEMAKRQIEPFRLSSGNLRHMYWTFGQMIAHHTSNGCNMLPGDLIASGTVSGPEPTSRGCLLELTWQGIDPATKKPLPRKPIELPSGEKRTFLADGDEVIFRAFCKREGFRRIGFGECRGKVLPAVEYP